MPDFNKNVWAPWRMQYIRSLADDVTDEGCFLCRYWEQPEGDVENHVVWRGSSAFVVMNRFPYTNGHLLIAHAHHKGELSELSDDALAELTCLIRDAVRVLKRQLDPQGFNTGYNLGRCPGAGLPDHLHAHVGPRWSGDTNFMAVLGDVRVVPDALDSLYAELVTVAKKIGLRS